MTPARFSERFLAYLLDVVLLVLVYLSGIAALLTFGVAPERVPRLVLFAGSYALFCAYTALLRGRTLGKRALGLSVVDSLGQPPSPKAAALRALGYLPSSAFNLGFLWALRGGRTWHDLLADTHVVETRDKSRLVRGALTAASVAAGLSLAAAWAFVIVAPRLDDATRIADATRVLNALSQLEESHKKLHGAYAEDVRQLAQMSADPPHFMDDLAAVYDLPAGFSIRSDGARYQILAHARDRRRTVVWVEGPKPAQ